MKHPTKRKQLAKSGEVLGTKNGRNESIEGHKENSRGVYATVRKKKDGEYYERDGLYVLITAIKAVF